MKDYFVPKTTGYNLQLKNPLDIPRARTTKNGIRSLSFQGPKIWNSLPESIKTAQNTRQFKNLIKTWFLCEIAKYAGGSSSVLQIVDKERQRYIVWARILILILIEDCIIP